MIWVSGKTKLTRSIFVKGLFVKGNILTTSPGGQKDASEMVFEKTLRTDGRTDRQTLLLRCEDASKKNFFRIVLGAWQTFSKAKRKKSIREKRNKNNHLNRETKTKKNTQNNDERKG